jgi:ribosomal protein L16 Arg81 hydroxylase
VAASQVYENPKLALRLLNWICAATTTQAGSVINYQARWLRNSLSFNASLESTEGTTKIMPSLTSYHVPSVNLQSCKQILKARLQAATAFEQSFQSFLAQDRSAANWVLLGNDLIVKSEKAIKEYTFTQDLTEKRYLEAKESCATSLKRFQVSLYVPELADARLTSFTGS